VVLRLENREWVSDRVGWQQSRSGISILFDRLKLCSVRVWEVSLEVRGVGGRVKERRRYQRV
jgi:hypothetical protein